MYVRFGSMLRHLPYFTAGARDDEAIWLSFALDCALHEACCLKPTILSHVLNVTIKNSSKFSNHTLLYLENKALTTNPWCWHNANPSSTSYGRFFNATNVQWYNHSNTLIPTCKICTPLWTWSPILGHVPRILFVARTHNNFLHLQQMPKGNQGQIEFAWMSSVNEIGLYSLDSFTSTNY